MTSSFLTHSEAETAEVGRRLAAAVSSGTVLMLFGDLGAGKTAFVRGLATGLDLDPRDVTSPTFTLVQEYRGGRVPLIHVDLYRLDDSREVEDLGLEELGAEAVLAIEWAEKLPRVPPATIRVSITSPSETERRIEIDDSGTYSDR